MACSPGSRLQEVPENGPGRIVPESHMGKSHRLLPQFFRQGTGGNRFPFRFIQEFPDVLDPGHGALDALDFHADAFQGTEDLPHISDHRHGRPNGKTEQIRPGRPLGGSHHDHRHHCRLGHQMMGE